MNKIIITRVISAVFALAVTVGFTIMAIAHEAGFVTYIGIALIALAAFAVPMLFTNDEIAAALFDDEI